MLSRTSIALHRKETLSGPPKQSPAKSDFQKKVDRRDVHPSQLRLSRGIVPSGPPGFYSEPKVDRKKVEKLGTVTATTTAALEEEG